MWQGALDGCPDAAACKGYVTVTPQNVGGVSTWTVSIAYPFEFLVLQPITKLVAGGSGTSNSLTMNATATMRIEGS
jgi:hypothetical protein